MHQNVVNFEPELALFVSDEDPLLFYKVIASKGKNLLKPTGKIYFEINERYGNEVIALLESMNYSTIRLIQDLNGKNRIITALNSN
jgi:release factor glutamine methyltransferase